MSSSGSCAVGGGDDNCQGEIDLLIAVILCALVCEGLRNEMEMVG